MRQKHGQAFARSAGLKKFCHRKRMTLVASLLKHPNELRCSFGQNDLTLEHHRIAGEMSRFFLRNINQIS